MCGELVFVMCGRLVESGQRVCKRQVASCALEMAVAFGHIIETFSVVVDG